MSDDMKVRVRRKNRFTVVDDRILECKELSGWARTTAAWLAGRSDGFQIRVCSLREYYLGISEKQWKSIRKELEAVGAWRSTRKKVAGGKFAWTHDFDADFIESEAISIPPSAIPAQSMDGEGMDALGTHAQRGDNHKDFPHKEKNQSDVHQKERKEPAAASGGGGVLVGDENEKTRDSDQVLVDRFIEENGGFICGGGILEDLAALLLSTWHRNPSSDRRADLAAATGYLRKIHDEVDRQGWPYWEIPDSFHELIEGEIAAAQFPSHLVSKNRSKK